MPAERADHGLDVHGIEDDPRIVIVAVTLWHQNLSWNVGYRQGRASGGSVRGSAVAANRAKTNIRAKGTIATTMQTRNRIRQYRSNRPLCKRTSRIVTPPLFAPRGDPIIGPLARSVLLVLCDGTRTRTVTKFGLHLSI